VRLFIGTFLSESNQRAYGQLVESLSLRHVDLVRGVPAGSAHLTYAFCADAPDDRVNGIAGAVSETTSQHRSFTIRLAPPRILFSRSTPRLICAGVVAGEAALRRLAVDLATNLQRVGSGLPWKPSKAPHVTLARFRKNARRSDAQGLMRTLMNAGDAFVGREDRIAQVMVVASELTASGPVYRIKAQLPLLSDSSLS
jgi:2'-5' RNA ligase